MRNIILIGKTLLLAGLFGLQAQAQVDIPDSVRGSLFKDVKFKCRIFASLGTAPVEELEETFEVSLKSKNGHGGDGFELSSARQNILAMADGTWLGVTWILDGELVAKSVVAQSNSTVEHRALILYHPKDENKQVHLDCSRKD